jgi:YtkA-like
MQSARKLRGTLLFAGLLAALGCGPNRTAGGTGGGGGGTSTAATTGTGMASPCAKDSRATPYAVGVQAKATDTKLTVHFMDADPAPPDKGLNTWTVQLLDGQGKPVNGATIVTKPYMPDHGHASPTKPPFKPKGMDGSYEIDEVNLFMPGLWQITFDVSAPGGVADSAVIDFCVDG